MSGPGEEWELSKENIRPIQQGRRQGALKVALAPHPEDVIAQQQQSFENELRTYSGSDPLSVWYKYIKWVEQNYPKGGKDGHIKELMEHCLSILKDDKRYFDDDRFVEIMLKFAGLSGKPLEIYNYMYSNNIGCKSAKFFINWSWQLEQLGNFKKADEVLTEGKQRRAEPTVSIQAYFKDFEIRLTNRIKSDSEKKDFEIESSRSAFSVLKPHKKKLAPIMRAGEAVVENRSSLTLGNQQPRPRSSASSGKVPFKIYNSENINPSLPVQLHSAHGDFSLSNYKENEQRPVKWNKYKVKTHSLKMPNEGNLDFKFHCDDEDNNDQEIQTPRSVPKTSSILSSRRRTPSPPIALFEPPDPLKKPMYPKRKVYCGTVEYSLEEIRAAEWLEKKKKIEHEKLLLEQQQKIEEQARKEEQLKKQIEFLSKKIQLLEYKVSDSSKLSQLPSTLVSNKETTSFKNEIDNNEFNNILLNSHTPTAQGVSEMKENANVLSLKKNLQNCNYNLSEDFENKCGDSTSFNTPDKILQELYNKTLSKATDEEESKNINININQNGKSSLKFSHEVTGKCFDSTEISSEVLNKNSLCSLTKLGETQNVTENRLPFTFYRDPSESAYNSSEIKQIRSLENVSKETSDEFLFKIYHDPTKNISVLNETNQINETHSLKNSREPFTPFHDSTGTVPNSTEIPTVKEIEAKGKHPLELPHESSEEDIENIPPKGYVQEKNKRELSGILEPSKNILFIPIEQQEMDDESDIEDDRIYLIGQQPGNETLIPPSNTEQFSAAKFLASTPYVTKNNKISNIETSNDQVLSSEKNNISHNSCLSLEILNHAPMTINDENAINKSELNSAKESVLSSELKSSGYSRLPNMLSVIMECSSENYSKSSSSSNSASLTKLNHFEQYSTHHLNFHKNSKLETCDPGIMNSVSDVSNHNSERMCKESKKNQFYLADIDPFDQKLTQKFLKSIDTRNYKNIYYVNKSIRIVKPGENICIGTSKYVIQELLAEGAYAKVYKAIGQFTRYGNHFDRTIALKVCKDSNEWEYYICSEIQKRLLKFKILPDIKDSVTNIISAIKYSDGIVLINEYSSWGTLLDVVNFCKKTNSAIPELIILYFTLEILHIVSTLHKCNIIHGDIKPDNFLLINNNVDNVLEKMTKTSYLKLIDFGRAIDLNLFDKGIYFTTIFSKKDMQCNEMKDKKPWVFQLDWYGVLSCIHTMLFLEYMVVKKIDGVWRIEKKFRRYWFTELWESIFDKLLNIPGCYEEPDMLPFINMIESKLQENSITFFNKLNRFLDTYQKEK